MHIMLNGIVFLIALALAGVMGFAIQRGGTCTVAAIEEVIHERRYTRIIALIEASLWVVGGLALAQTLHLLAQMPTGYAVSALTVAGGALLGLGAYVNGACVFGAVASIGSGSWSYLATPLGFYAGCLSFTRVFGASGQRPLPYGSPVLHAAQWIAFAFAGFMLWRLTSALRVAHPNAKRRGVIWRVQHALAQRVWSPHAATTVIGIAFFFMLMLVGAWAYTDVLAELAHGMAADLAARTLLVLALFAGAAVGGWTAGRFRSTRISLKQIGRCLVGGLLMGWGSLMIPGGNDGLILIGIPLLWPYALLAFATMCVSIGAAVMIEKSFAQKIA